MAVVCATAKRFGAFETGDTILSRGQQSAGIGEIVVEVDSVARGIDGEKLADGLTRSRSGKKKASQAFGHCDKCERREIFLSRSGDSTESALMYFRWV